MRGGQPEAGPLAPGEGRGSVRCCRPGRASWALALVCPAVGPPRAAGGRGRRGAVGGGRGGAVGGGRRGAGRGGQGPRGRGGAGAAEVLLWTLHSVRKRRRFAWPSDTLSCPLLFSLPPPHSQVPTEPPRGAAGTGGGPRGPCHPPRCACDMLTVAKLMLSHQEPVSHCRRARLHPKPPNKGPLSPKTSSPTGWHVLTLGRAGGRANGGHRHRHGRPPRPSSEAGLWETLGHAGPAPGSTQVAEARDPAPATPGQSPRSCRARSPWGTVAEPGR